MRKYRWGVLATGRIAGIFTEGLAGVPDAILYAVGSRDKGKAGEFEIGRAHV